MVAAGLEDMTTGNSTELVGFILMGLSNDPELQIPLFVVFLVIYTITLIGNLAENFPELKLHNQTTVTAC
ncbi:hypothetical protein Y1Q_0012206 [Alligator mississippiensis]|uniref:Uncharacterized protein n=1 Tax=Alligator mississippiensis TaxID=8496 RepID=A0A151NUW1_ALLMI|nr:hypothetical protein Y1Q_0012206 [Alligator mississippiensis]